MSVLSQSASAAMDGASTGVGTVSTTGDHLDAAGSHPAIVDALGQESVDRLLAGAKAVVDGAAATAQALHESIKVDSVAAKADDVAASADAGDVTDQSAPEAVDVDKLRDATTKMQAVVAQAHELADTLEQTLGDEQVMSRVREQLGASGEEADLEAVKGALAGVNPDNAAFGGEIRGLIDHVSAAGKDVPPDLQDAVQQLEGSLNDSAAELGRLIERLRDMSIAAVGRLA
jgi:hypothetical protein